MSMEGKSTQVNSKELTEEQLLSLLEIKIGPNDSLKDILRYFKIGNFVAFIIDKNFNIVFTNGVHKILLANLGLDWADCFVDNGLVIIHKDSKIEFMYSNGRRKEKIDNFFKVAESKIKDFLISNGLEVR